MCSILNQIMARILLWILVLGIVFRPIGAFKFDYVSEDRRVQDGEDIRLISLVSGNNLSNNNWKICKWMRGSNICEFQWSCKGMGCTMGNGEWSYKKSCTYEFHDLTLLHSPLRGKNQLCGVYIPSGNKTLHEGEWTLQVNQCKSLGCSYGGNEVWIEESVTLDFE